MATLKYRLNRKNSSGGYDTIHYETSSNIVMRSNGESVEVALARADDHETNTNNPHNVTASQVGAAASSHTHAAGDVTSGTFNTARIPNLAASKINAGTLNGQVLANASAAATIGTAQLRNIKAQTSDPGAGSSLTTGQILLIYE